MQTKELGFAKKLSLVILLPKPPLGVFVEERDRLPLWILAGLVLTELVYVAALAVRVPSSDGRGMPARAAGFVGDEPDDEDTAVTAFDLEVCNHTDAARVFIAVAYYDVARTDWVARGWYPQNQGDCQVTLRSLKPPVYVYAETKDGRGRWGDAAPAETSREFCIHHSGPFVRGQRDCTGRADDDDRLRRQRFMRLELAPASMTRRSPSGAPMHVWELTE